jgi:hypothetical protein
LKTAKEKNAVIMFGDEASFAMWGSLSRTWAPTGKQPTLKTTGRRKGLKMFGAIEFQSGRFIFMETLNSPAEFYEVGRIDLVKSPNSFFSHKATVTQRFLSPRRAWSEVHEGL